MTKINIFSGFLGAGKTTLIQKLMRMASRIKLLLLRMNLGKLPLMAAL